MKKILTVIICIALMAIAVSVPIINFMLSPEYSLRQIQKDIKSDGIDGLMPHLTGSAKATVETAVKVLNNPLVQSAVDILADSEISKLVSAGIENISWEMTDILKSKDRADVIVHFEYDSSFSGEIRIKLIKENKEWKISGVGV